MVTVVNVTNFRNNIGTYLDKLISRKEPLIITKGNRIVAKLVAATETPQRNPPDTSPFLKLAGLWSDANST